MKIIDILSDKQTISFEFFPPRRAEGIPDVVEKMKMLSAYTPDFISVTYGAGGSTQGFTEELSRIAKADLNLEVMSHITCVGQTTEEIDHILSRLKSSNIDNIIGLRGDPPKGSYKFIPTVGGFQYASELINHINNKFEFCVAAAAYPESHTESTSIDTDIEHLKEKVDMGVDFLITQLFFDNDYYFNFVERARKAGIQIPIIPALLPILNASQIRRFTTLCGASIPEQLNNKLTKIEDDDDQVIQLGIQYASQQAENLLSNKVPGVHFYVLNKNYSVQKILKNLNLVPH